MPLVCMHGCHSHGNIQFLYEQDISHNAQLYCQFGRRGNMNGCFVRILVPEESNFVRKNVI